jgi:hypothetical protein
VSDDARTWHVSLDGRQEGPLSTAQVLEGFASGRWHAGALVFTESLGAWTKAQQVGEIAPLLRKRGIASMPPRQLRIFGWLLVASGIAWFALMILTALAGGHVSVIGPGFVGASMGPGLLFLWHARKITRASRIAQQSPPRQDSPSSETRP